MWLTKSDEETNPEYGKYPKDRNINELIDSSVLIVDKHAGPTSHQVTAWIRDIFNAKNCGHSGTLDPGVTGVLPVALGNATKVMPVLTGLDKEYVGTMHLHKEVPEDMLRNVIVERFIGKIRQRPPVKSAVARIEREREIHFFDILEIDGKDVLFKVGCEAGTYIRKLCHDIGRALNVGAHMSELRRTKVGNFTENDAHSLVEVRDAYEIWKENNDEANLRNILIPVEYATLHTKRIFVKDSAVASLCNGSPLYPRGITRIQEGIIRGETIAVMTLKEELIALGIAKMTSDEMFKRKTGVACRIDRVLMPMELYPKWDR
ncbi:MAG: RNA-guided pseudouridylation complex pseudouridine synthase subunit Cbf5 [Candidatus Aenigmarchaeota archaeon]|nr:RNA-guided pseudouridylation complex pseudouridine synthase subunit Cbf5 [Candidatus Aenigmarchaeota archaeon]